MEHRYEKYWDYNGSRVIECISCGYRHVYLIPDTEQIKGYYDEKYYSEVKPFDYEALTKDSISEKAEEVYSNVSYKAVYDKVIELKKASGTGMLDIGCGNDLLALYFRHNGWQAAVIEPNVMAARYLEQFGLTIMNDYFENIHLNKLEEIAFINLQFVLEHLQDPSALLKEAYELLMPGGIIRICVPNDFSKGQLAYSEYFKEEHSWIAIPDHINYMDFESLNGLLSKTGFEELYRTTNFPLEFLLMGGINYYGEQIFRDQVGPFVSNFENSLIRTGQKQLLDRLYEELAKLGFGRSIYMYAIKR